MNKSITAFSIAFGIASLGICAQASATVVDEEIVSYHISQKGEGQIFSDKEMTGFWAMEEGHTWSVNDKASLSIPTFHNGKRIVQATIPNVGALVNELHKMQVASVGLQNRPLVDYEFSVNAPVHNISVNFPKDLAGDKAVIEFHTPNSCLVSVAYPGSPDTRKLGIRVNTLLVKYVKEAENESGATPLSPPPPPPPMKKPAADSGATPPPAKKPATPKAAAPKAPTGSGPNLGNIAEQAKGAVLKKAPPKAAPAPAAPAPDYRAGLKKTGNDTIKK